MSTIEFAAARRKMQDDAIEQLLPFVTTWLTHPNDTTRTALQRELVLLYRRTYTAEGGEKKPRTVRAPVPMSATIDQVLNNTKPTSNPETVTTLLAVAVTNAAIVQAASDASEPMLLEWVTMHDDKVRATHRAVDGQRRPTGEKFTVDGEHLLYPGQPVGEPAVWINCRCTLAPVAASSVTERAEGGVTMTDTTTEPEVEQTTEEPDSTLAAVPWHGVLAPEGKWSGDGRRFADNSLTTRDLPLPLTWQKASSDGHDGSITVARIDDVQRVDGEMRAHGSFLAIPEADEVVGLLADFGRFGVSVDADDAEFEFDEETNQVTFTAARIASASIVAIPAFAEAWVALGTPPDGFLPESGSIADTTAASLGEEVMEHFVSDKPWSDFSQGDYSDDQWYSACVLHKNGSSRSKSDNGLPIKEPGGALNRNGVHAAAARFNQVQAPAAAKAAAKSALRGAYKQIGEDPPDVLAAGANGYDFTSTITSDGTLITYNNTNTSTVEWGRGPGWITNPEDTKRIHDYWTVPGQEGYAKIGWGSPGDFDRCRAEVGSEIAENSPEKVRFINQICSQWHHDATGFWPGHAPAERVASGDPAPALSLVAAGGRKAPAAWFANPNLDLVTHLTVSDEGRVFGHLAEWGVCHIGYEEACVVAPASTSGYAYFATGQVLLDDGTTARTGVISLGGGHAGRGGVRATTEHYDSTSHAVADVSVGEDEHGIWCAGWIRPGVTDDQVVALRASDVSGDWREVGGNLELVAALAVNVAGLPVIRVNEGQQVMLVAAGVIHAQAETNPTAELAEAIVAAMDARDARKTRMQSLIARVRKETSGV